MWKLASFALCVVVAGCNGGGKSTTVAAPVKPGTLVGNWMEDSSTSDYREGIYFDKKGTFVRWGMEKQGGWRTGGDYVVKGSRVRFKSTVPNAYNFGPREDDLEGEADLVWKSEDNIEFKGQGRTLALHRVKEVLKGTANGPQAN